MQPFSIHGWGIGIKRGKLMFVCLFVCFCLLVGWLWNPEMGTSGLYSAYFLQILTHFCFRLGGLRGESRSHKQPPQQYQLSSAFPALLMASEPHYQRDAAVGCSDTSADTESQSAEARSKDCNRDREIEIDLESRSTRDLRGRELEDPRRL